MVNSILIIICIRIVLAGFRQPAVAIAIISSYLIAIAVELAHPNLGAASSRLGNTTNLSICW